MAHAPCLVSYNGTNYDIAMLREMARGSSVEKVNAVSNSLVTGRGGRPEYLKTDPQRHIDCDRLVVGIRSLKELGAMLHMPSIEELPHPPDAEVGDIDGDTARHLRDYCVNDCVNTLILHDRLGSQVELRKALNEKYPLRRSSGFSFAMESQIGERLIESRCGKPPPVPKSVRTFKWQRPPYLAFKDEAASALLDEYSQADVEVHPGGGAVNLPPELRLKAAAFRYGPNNFVFGTGGLHTAQKQPVFAKSVPGEFEIRDYDVSSYYPNILLRNGMQPVDNFHETYKSLVEQRLEAKRSGDEYEAAGLKIAINGTFGKLLQPGSAVYSPETFFDVVATGQFALLMLVEQLSDAGATIMSANTDGVIVSCDPKVHDLDGTAIADWQKQTGFNLERTDYDVLAMRDVNNYVALTPNGKAKGKGVYAPRSAQGDLRTRPAFDVCSSAVVDWLRNGVAPEEHIASCDDLRLFLSVRKINAGVVDESGRPIGKVVRYYKTKRSNAVLLSAGPSKSGAQSLIPEGKNAQPVDVLTGSPPPIPDDLDRDFYIDRAHDMVAALGDNSLAKMRMGAQVDMFDF